ncbi:MAG: LytR C-terminal domain-containing protein [Bacteroidota bacterium]
MARPKLVDGLLNVALVGVGLLVLVLLYGLVTRAFTPRTTPLRDTPIASDGPRVDPIQVEVRNAVGVDGLGRETTAYLRRRGFDVVAVGNADYREESAVVVRAGTEEYARRVAAALGAPEAAIENAGPVAVYDPDVEVFIGADFATLSPFQPPDSTQ